MIKTCNPKPIVSYKKIVTTLATRNELLEIYECVNSGKVITREKIDTITKVFHPSVIIGEDIYGRIWVVHNHYLNKSPMFELCESFLQGKDLLWDSRTVEYNRDEIVERAIAEVRFGKKYNSVNYNCQTFVNLVVRNEHKSEAVDKISDDTMALGSILALLGLIFKSKALLYTGLGVAGIGGAAKGFSRIR